MKIAIMSDSHGRTSYVEKAVLEAGEVDLWLHCGDLISDADYLRTLTDAPVVNVAGNCDWRRGNTQYIEILELKGHRLLLTHGHEFNVKYNRSSLRAYAEQADCDIAVYGHTHISEISQKDGVLILNPGSVALPRDESKPSFMVIELTENNKPDIFLYRL